MERSMIPACAIIGFICIGLVYGQTLKVSPKNAYASAGEDYELTCNCNEVDMAFYMNNRIVYTHRKEDGTETVITNNGYLTTPDVLSQQYSVEMVEHAVEGWTVTLTVKAVDDSQAGLYICSVQSGAGVESDRKNIKFTVLYPISDLSLKVGDEIITQTTMESVEFLEGVYNVKCETAGSNPEPILEVYIGEERQDMATALAILDANLPHRGYKASVSQDLYLSEQHDGKHIKCMATVPHSGYENKEAGLNLKIIPLTPTITCMNSSALLGDRRAVLSCNITSQSQINCENTMWENGNQPGLFYQPGQMAPDKNKAECTKINANSIRSDLIIHYVNDDTFKTTYFLDFLYHEGKHRHPVYLTKKPGSGASSMKPVALVIVVLSVMASYFNRK